MTKRSTHFSRRHLLALGTFLVPLIAIAVLGANELRRSGEMTQTVLDGGAIEFLNGARNAIEQQVDLQVPAALAASARLLHDRTPPQTAMRLRNEEGIPSVLDVLLLNDQASVIWPSLPTYSIDLPFANQPSEATRGRLPQLARAELLLEHGELRHAMVILTQLITTLQNANPPQEDGPQRSDLVEAEIHARFRYGSALRQTGELDRARDEFAQVEQLASRYTPFNRAADMAAIVLCARSARAELGPADERLELIRSIAEGGHHDVSDGWASAVARRLAATFSEQHALRPQIDHYLREDDQRAGSREFATTYELWIKPPVRYRILRLDPEPDADDVDRDLAETPRALASLPSEVVVRHLTTLDEHTSLLAVRRSPREERDQHGAAFVAVHFDLDELLRPALETYIHGDGNFVLAVDDPDGVAIVAPPDDVPDDYTPPSTVDANGLLLRAYPADPAGMLAAANAANRNYVLLLLALFLTAVGGALWSWRSVSREAELAALKIDLVSRVSHELKTPLALIRMYGETLGMGRARDGEQSREFGTIIARESERLTTLIQRILDFSRQQAGSLTYSRHRHDLGELLRETAYAYAPHLEARGVMLIDSLPLGIEVECDKDGLEGAIINLLENTTKYGRDGEDEQEVELLLEARGDHAVIEVKDRGRGIPDGEHSRIFDGFYRASNSGEVRGAGLGLGIVQHFARAHDGDIEALPRKGGGTIMRLSLPLSRRRRDPSRPVASTRKDSSQ